MILFLKMVLKRPDLSVCYKFWVMAVMLIAQSFVTLANQPARLDDYQVWRINSVTPIEPSGLYLKDGTLFTVCDDANQIFRLEFGQDGQVDVITSHQLPVDQLAALNLDMEGITAAGDDFFVVSEAHHKLVRVTADGIHWVPDLGGVYAKAFKEGLFQKYNAGLEAVTYLGNQTFLLSVEREPRGLIEVTFDADFKHIVKQTNQIIPSSSPDLSATRQPDLTGLFLHDGMIYALHRNAYLIHELIKNEDGIYQEGRSWSYEHTVRHPDYAYQDMQFGHAEGLAVDDDYFYLVIDNNHIPNAKNPNNNQPILIRAKRQ